MTAGDIPVTTGNPDQGFEGYRFVGYNLYDALLLWDLSRSDLPSEPKPGLATSYEIDPTNQKRWIVHLRQGAAWHDGCKFTADDVVWNFQMRMDQNAPNFSPQQFTYTRAFLSNVKAVTKVDDYTVAIENNFVESLFPYTLTYVLMISPCRAKEVNYDWGNCCTLRAPALQVRSGGPPPATGAAARTQYWDKTRVPAGPIVLVPMPEVTTRTAVATGRRIGSRRRHPTRSPGSTGGMKIVTISRRLVVPAQLRSRRSGICGSGRRRTTRSTGKTS
jgi:ABC-type transport system substrate-binding protein